VRDLCRYRHRSAAVRICKTAVSRSNAKALEI
jgi:hypothetical protein